MTRWLDDPMTRFIEEFNLMPRRAVSKMQTLEARHPGLRQKVLAMFDEFWPVQDVKHMLETHYGERMSLNTLARHKRLHWQAQRALLQEMTR